ncbi:NADPH-dependent 2,4-dienoyl-CoA reductase/sulfur reductase-like enzyme [Arthrobacter globiformis]|uniref:NAD(P)/FAD-dependent oxidoreductase n=1 Tax=Arthrobacter globiformis TaxID=1665 RepID=UPI00278B880D|nr:FAD-dependent oxidoreductase [Arthrobacter globiformis]MDQ1059411.1 NADPH-dependent 2,4-dienoyl-CoA reductase/sulfur reductase-like enzyme [Arthrobacter globiformis]
MTPESIVIAGAGLAGATAARTLRAEGYAGNITIAGTEPHPPYLRPPLSKEYLLGKAGEDAVEIVPESWYADNNVSLRLDTPVASVDPAAHTVRFADGTVQGYGALLLAPGATPRTLPLSGAELDGVSTFRTLDDSRRLREQLVSGGRNVVLIGSGWIGMELAAAASTYGNQVTLLGLEDIPLAAAIGPELGGFFRTLHEDNGVRFRLPASRPGDHRTRRKGDGRGDRRRRAPARGHRGHRCGSGSGNGTCRRGRAGGPQRHRH